MRASSSLPPGLLLVHSFASSKNFSRLPLATLLLSLGTATSESVTTESRQFLGGPDSRDYLSQDDDDDGDDEKTMAMTKAMAMAMTTTMAMMMMMIINYDDAIFPPPRNPG